MPNNANIEQIYNEFPLSELQNGDILAVFRPSQGKTGGILAENIQIGDSSQFEWDPLEDYDLDEVVTYQGLWWQSLVPGVGTNTGNIPSEGVNWTQINKINGVIIPEWSAGLITDHLTLFREGTTIYGLKNTAVLPYNSTVTPSADLANWEIVGGGGGDQLNIDAGRPSRDDPTSTEVNGGRPSDF